MRHGRQGEPPKSPRGEKPAHPGTGSPCRRSASQFCNGPAGAAPRCHNRSVDEPRVITNNPGRARSSVTGEAGGQVQFMVFPRESRGWEWQVADRDRPGGLTASADGPSDRSPAGTDACPLMTQIGLARFTKNWSDCGFDRGWCPLSENQPGVGPVPPGPRRVTSHGDGRPGGHRWRRATRHRPDGAVPAPRHWECGSCDARARTAPSRRRWAATGPSAPAGRRPA